MPDTIALQKTKTATSLSTTASATAMLTLSTVALSIAYIGIVTASALSARPSRMFITLGQAVNSGLSYGSTGAFIRGDANGDRKVDVSDSIAITNYAACLDNVGCDKPSLGCTVNQGLCFIACPDADDTNDDGKVTKADADYLLAWLFSGGTTIPAPYPNLGSDPTVDTLGCSRY